MPYALTVSRNGAVIDAPNFGGALKPVPRDALEQTFEQHAAHMCHSRAFGSVDAALMDVVHSEDRHARWTHLPQTVSVTTEGLRKASAGTPASFMARFPVRKLECTLGDTTWLVRAFAVATSHALQEGAGKTRLWWNFEACPKNSVHHPTQTDALRFLDMADRMEDEAMPLLRCAYEHALEEEAGIPDFPRNGSRIRVSLTDADTKPATALESWLNIVDQTGQERTRRAAMPAEAKKGVDVLSSYVRRALHIPVTPAYPITLLKEAPGMTGIVVRRENEEGVLVTGLVRRENPHMLNQHGETNMRKVSGALFLSELVARREGMNFGVKIRAPELVH